MRINADDDASIDVYTKDGKAKLCTINCFDFGGSGGIDVIPANGLRANALVFRMTPEAPAIKVTHDGEPGREAKRYRMTSNGLVAVELK